MVKLRGIDLTPVSYEVGAHFSYLGDKLLALNKRATDLLSVVKALTDVVDDLRSKSSATCCLEFSAQ